MKTLEDERYVVIKAYKFTVFEIWRDLNVLSYIACPRYPYIRVYRLYDEYIAIKNSSVGADTDTSVDFTNPSQPLHWHGKDSLTTVVNQVVLVL